MASPRRPFASRPAAALGIALVAATAKGAVAAQGRPDARPAISATPMPVPEELVAGRAGGLTAKEAGSLARRASLRAQALLHTSEASAARVDEVRSALWPRAALHGTWRRIGAPPEPPSQLPDASVVLTTAPGGTLNPSQTFAYKVDLTFPALQNQYLLEAAVDLPVSDYFTRLVRELRAASYEAQAARLDVVNSERRAEIEGRLAFYTWMRGRALYVVAVQTLNDRRQRLEQARNLWSTGQGSASDLRLAEANTLGAELELERMRANMEVVEKQLRVIIGGEVSAPLVLGEGIDETAVGPPAELARLIDLAFAHRPELRALDDKIAAAGEQERAAIADQLPSVAGGASLIYANPSPLRAAQVDAWTLGWTAGVSLRWSLDRCLAAAAVRRERGSQRRALEADQAQARRTIELEVLTAREDLVAALLTAQIAARQLEAAQEAHRAASDQFRNGLRDSATLVSGEDALRQARLASIQARIESLAARVRLASALGVEPEQLP